MRVAVVGAGGHSRAAHLPALAALRETRDVEIVAIADPNVQTAREAAERFDVGEWFTDARTMLASVAPEVCLLLVPTSVTPSLAREVVAQGVAALLEKPFADSVAEGEALVEALGGAAAMTMVSANRRFDPALVAALQWLDAPIDAVQAVMARADRAEPDFIYRTGIHVIDSLRYLIPDLVPDRVTGRWVAGALWCAAGLGTADGRTVELSITPTAGAHLEEVTLFSAARSARVRFGVAADAGYEGWAAGERVVQYSTSAQPSYERDGTLAETVAFLDAVARGGPSPVPLEGFLQSMRLAAAIATAADKSAHASGPR